MDERVSRIRALNDAFRQTFVGGVVLITRGVEDLPLVSRSRVLSRVRSFEEFTDDNDPHGEHDFVAFAIDKVTYFAKIDYYDRSMDGGSSDPSDVEQTTRVLTIMRADEY